MANIKAILMLCAITCTVVSYPLVKTHGDHLHSIHTKNYVIALFYDSKSSKELASYFKNIASELSEFPNIKNQDIQVELVDTDKLTQLDTMYKLEGRSAVIFFVRGKVFEYNALSTDLDDLFADKLTEQQLASKIDEFVASQISKISIEVTDMDQFTKLLNMKRILGVYFGCKGEHFDKYFLVATKYRNLDFAHVRDIELQNQIFAAFPGSAAAQGDFFTIIRHESRINEYDTQYIAVTVDLNEKELTQFIDYERFDKLRGMECTDEIIKSMFARSQPLLLYVKATQKESAKFKNYKHALKSLPKRFIYAYTEADERSAAGYLQLFVMAETQMVPENLFIVWIQPSRKPKVEVFNEEMNDKEVKHFVFNFFKDHEHVFDHMSQHLYDKQIVGTVSKDSSSDIIDEEL